MSRRGAKSLVTLLSISGAQGTLDSAAYEESGTLELCYQVNVTSDL